MKLTWDDILANAVSFSKRWKDAHDEMSEAQSFVRDFLAVFGVQDPLTVGRFEERAQRESGRGRMDYFWPKQIAIEMKSKGKDLGEAYRQLKDYVIHLPSDDMPELLMVTDFEKIVLYNRTTGEPTHFKTIDLHKNIRRFANIAGFETTREMVEQLEVNVQAAEKMAILHDALKKRGYEGHELEIYLVRLLFCLFADCTDVFPRQTFLNYIQNSKDDGSDLSERIFKLFEILNMPDETREKKTLLSANIKQFRYINGGLFKDPIPSAQFDPKMRGILFDCCFFDWSKISPAIFGAMFQGIMDRELRREIGAHYTSEENILKLINPLFMNELWREFNILKTDLKALDKFHEKIANLKFLDPACGCGNFLIIAYRELRLLELEVLKIKESSGQVRLAFAVADLLKVNVSQFYGIEIEEFPCQVAQTGMWLMDHLMNMRVSTEFGQHYVRLPLTTSATIVHANAHRIDWSDVAPKEELSYILGNPPFVGARWMNNVQKDDMRHIFGALKGLGNLDYVTAWYKRASDMMSGTTIRAAFVSTNSIAQGEQVAILWKPLIDRGVFINFGIPTFKWSSEAKGKAAVHCVIAGFSYNKTEPNINPYLVEAPTVFIESRTSPISDVPPINYGSFALDDGNYTISAEEYDEIAKAEPNAKPFLRPFIGARELIHNEKRYCVWLLGVEPSEISESRTIMQKINNVRIWRGKSRRKNTALLAETPTLFAEIRQPETSYLAIPTVSSEVRKYIPIAYLKPETIASNQLYVVPNSTHYHFGVLTSSVHNAWVRAVCGRLEMRYRYSAKIVYNNFPWPDATNAQGAEIEKLAEDILEIRALFPKSSLAILYNPLTMPPELLKAHHSLDRAVMKLYGFAKDTPEPAIVAKLMERYLKITKSKMSCV